MKKLVIALLAIFLPFRLYHLTFPLLDAFNFRQTQTATFTLNMYKYGINLFQTELDIFGLGKEKYLLLEFPIYEAIVAFIYKIFFVHDAWGRIVTIASGFIGAFFLFRLVLLITGNRKLGFLSAFFFLAAPLSMFYQRTFMIDPTIVTFLLAGSFFFCRWVVQGGKINYAASLFLLTSGFPQKGLYGPFWLLPLVWFWVRLRRKSSKPRTHDVVRGKLAFLISMAAPLIILYFWQQYVNRMNIEHGQLFFTTIDVGHLSWNFGTWADRLNWPLWQYRLRQLYNGIFLKPGLVLFFAGLFSIRSFDKSRFFQWFLLSQILYFIVVFRIQAQNYYQLIMVPAFAVILASGTLKLSQILPSKFIISFICAFYLWRSWVSIQPSFSIDWDWYGRLIKVGQKLEGHHAGILATAGNEWNSAYTYYTGKKMKQTGVEKITPESIQKWRIQGYSFILLIEFEKYDSYLKEVNPNHSIGFLESYPEIYKQSGTRLILIK